MSNDAILAEYGLKMFQFRKVTSGNLKIGKLPVTLAT